MSWGILAILAVATIGLGVLWFNRQRTVEVPCTLDLERTHEHFHAHVELLGVLADEGDAVRVTEAPSRLEYGEIRRIESRAVVRKASWLRRRWTRLVGVSEVQELFEVGFE
jgi:hypothetical protein